MGSRGWTWLTAIVLVHLVVSVVHGWAHARASVLLSDAGNLFVFVVILVGPLAGLALTWWSDRVGNRVIAVTLAASLVFGAVNHFVLASPDHVTRVAAPWQPLFAATAVLLALTEALGSGLAFALSGRKLS